MVFDFVSSFVIASSTYGKRKVARKNSIHYEDNNLTLNSCDCRRIRSSPYKLQALPPGRVDWNSYILSVDPRHVDFAFFYTHICNWSIEFVNVMEIAYATMVLAVALSYFQVGGRTPTDL